MIVQLLCLCMSCAPIENSDEVKYAASMSHESDLKVVLQEDKCKCRRPKEPT